MDGPERFRPPEASGTTGGTCEGGIGPLAIGTLASLIPPGMKSETADAGEILTGLCALLGQEPMIHHLSPEATLLTSIQTTVNARAFSQPTPWAQDSDTLIFQFGRSDPAGSKLRQRTTYPHILDSESYQLASGRPMVHPLSLQAVIVHRGHVANKGHYIIFIKLTEGSGWALCDDDKVQWVLEMEALAQEALILIYTSLDTLGTTGAGQTNARIVPTMPPPSTVQPISTNTATHKPGVSAITFLGIEELFAEMTIRDKPAEEEA